MSGAHHTRKRERGKKKKKHKSSLRTSSLRAGDTAHVRVAHPSAICGVRDSRFLGLDSRPSVAGLHPGSAAPTSPSRCLGTPLLSAPEQRAAPPRGGQLLSSRSRKDKPSTYPAPAIGKVPGWCLTYCILITLTLSFLEDAVLILLDERRN